MEVKKEMWCPRKHNMDFISGGSEKRYKCIKCNNSSPNTNPRWRCNICNYNVCVGCTPGPKGPVVQPPL